MDIDERTILQKQFELQTPTIKNVRGMEYLQTYCSFLEFQHENQQKEIEQLREEIRMLKQYQQIAINDKHHRKKRLNKALEEIKELKNK